MLFIINFAFMSVFVNAQTDISDDFIMPSQTFMRFNKNLINPTLSIFNSYKSEYVVYHRNQWFEYDESPKTYMLNYVGNKFEDIGYGVSLYQQDVGIWRSIGGIGNYAKGVTLNDNTILSVGFNLIYYNSGLNRSKIIIGEPDPLLEQYDNTNILMLNPGFSLEIGNINFGVYGDNLVDYNFKNSKMQTKFGEKTISGHISYKYAFDNAYNLLENSSLTFLGRGKYNKMNDFDYSAGILYNVPRAGWVQGTYSDYYGFSGGLGITISQKIAIGYNYEKSIGSALTNLGGTHEVFFALTLGSNEEFSAYSNKIKKEEETNDIKNQTLEQEEIDRFKQNIYNQTIIETNPITVRKLEEFIINAENDNINYLLLPEKNMGIKKGYYVIATIYKEKEKAKKYVDDLKEKGLSKSGTFKTSINQWNYVYIERFDNYEAAKKAYQTKFNKKYPETMWVLPIF